MQLQDTPGLCIKLTGCLGAAGYTVNVSAIAPLSQNITQAGDDLLDEQGNPHLLIQPLVQVSLTNPCCNNLTAAIANCRA